jgi:hypothetical protein
MMIRSEIPTTPSDDLCYSINLSCARELDVFNAFFSVLLPTFIPDE